MLTCTGAAEPHISHRGMAGAFSNVHRLHAHGRSAEHISHTRVAGAFSNVQRGHAHFGPLGLGLALVLALALGAGGSGVSTSRLVGAGGSISDCLFCCCFATTCSEGLSESITPSSSSDRSISTCDAVGRLCKGKGL